MNLNVDHPYTQAKCIVQRQTHTGHIIIYKKKLVFVNYYLIIIKVIDYHFSNDNLVATVFVLI